MKHEMIKTDNEDEQCLNGECNLKKVDGTDYCPKCGGARIAHHQAKERVRTYQLTKFKARLERFGGSNCITDLRDEIGILRMTMEARLNACNTDLELIAHSHSISDMAVKIEKLVSSCHRLEKSMGNFMDKNTITQLGMEIVQIITKHVDDSKAIDNITSDLATALQRMTDESSGEIS